MIAIERNRLNEMMLELNRSQLSFGERVLLDSRARDLDERAYKLDDRAFEIGLAEKTRASDDQTSLFD